MNSGHHGIDALAVPYALPSVGDHKAALYHHQPPSPIRCRSTLRPIPLTPSDFAVMNSPRKNQTTSHHETTPNSAMCSSYKRFFDAPSSSNPSQFNNPYSHRTAGIEMQKSTNTSHLFGSSAAYAPITNDVQPKERVSEYRQQQSHPAPPTPIPPPPPRLGFADRLLLQASAEEKLLVAHLSAREAESSSPRSQRCAPVDLSKMKNMFLQSQAQPQPSPRRRHPMW